MKFLRHPILASLLVGCLLLVAGVFSAQATEHSVHHGHHNAATHLSPLCSWLCAAGQVLQAFELGLNGPSFGLVLFDPWSPTPTDKPSVKSALSRAPPSLHHLQ